MDKLSIAIIIIAIAFIGVGINTLFTEPEYQGGGWFIIAIAVAVLAGLLYKNATKRPGQ